MQSEFDFKKITDYIELTFNTVDSKIEEFLNERSGCISTGNAYEKALELGYIQPLSIEKNDSNYSLINSEFNKLGIKNWFPYVNFIHENE